MTEKAFALDGPSLDSVIADADQLWLEVLQIGSSARQAAVAAGVPVESLPSGSRSNAFSVRRDKEGIDPLLTGFLIGVATEVAGAAVWTFVERILIPYLHQKYGKQAVKARDGE